MVGHRGDIAEKFKQGHSVDSAADSKTVDGMCVFVPDAYSVRKRLASRVVIA